MRPRRMLELVAGRIQVNWRDREVAQVYLEPRDWWIGAFLGEHAVFVCPLPCVVLKVWRKDA